MEIPDSLSDMDSIPETVSLSRSVEAASAGFLAAKQDLEDIHLPALTNATERATEALRSFTAAWEVGKLESLYRD